MSDSTKPTTYKDAGVDIEAGEALVRRIAPLAKSTHRPEVLDDLGGFGALFALGGEGRYRQPVLVSSTDGVGTKVKLATAMGRHDTIGIDLVAMVVNDILTTGAEPLFFLDYFACGELDVDVAEQVVSGIAEGCKQAGCALIGGETAEMPDVYATGDYDMAGFGVGLVERDEVIDGSSTHVGSKLIGIASSGIHSNGYSLVRKVLGTSARNLARTPEGFDVSLGEILLRPTRIYAKAVHSLLRSGVQVLTAAHITGGGLPGNLPRVLPKRVRAVIERGSWPRPPIFELIASRGKIDEAEMLKTFNMGVGMVLAVNADEVDDAVDRIRGNGEDAWVIGEVRSRDAGEPEIDFV